MEIMKLSALLLLAAVFSPIIGIASMEGDLPIWVVMASSSAVSALGGMARSRRRGSPIDGAVLDGLLLGVIGLSGSSCAVVWLQQTQMVGAGYLVVGLAGFAGLLSIKVYDAAILGVFGKIVQRFIGNIKDEHE